MKWEDKVPAAIGASSNTYITYVADQPSAGDEHAIAVPPDLVQLVLKVVVFLHVAELGGVIVVFLEIEIWR